jgi:hypothetical protein
VSLFIQPCLPSYSTYPLYLTFLLKLFYGSWQMMQLRTVNVEQVSKFPLSTASCQTMQLTINGYNGYNGKWPSARLFGWSADYQHPIHFLVNHAADCQHPMWSCSVDIFPQKLCCRVCIHTGSIWFKVVYTQVAFDPELCVAAYVYTDSIWSRAVLSLMCTH